MTLLDLDQRDLDKEERTCTHLTMLGQRDLDKFDSIKERT